MFNLPSVHRSIVKGVTGAEALNSLQVCFARMILIICIGAYVPYRI